MPPGRDARVVRAWEDAILLNEKYGVGGSRPQGWADVISESALDAMPKIVRDFSKAVELQGRIKLPEWAQMLGVQSPRSGGAIPGLPAPMSVAITSAINLTGGINLRDHFDVGTLLQHPITANINDIFKLHGSIDIRRFVDTSWLNGYIDDRVARSTRDRRSGSTRDGF